MSDGGKGDDDHTTDRRRFRENFGEVNFDAEKDYEPEIIKSKIGKTTYRFKPKDK